MRLFVYEIINWKINMFAHYDIYIYLFGLKASATYLHINYNLLKQTAHDGAIAFYTQIHVELFSVVALIED